MTPEQFQRALPLVSQWMGSTLQSFSSEAKPVASIGFDRLERYFGKALLSRAKFVIVDKVPVPPLSEMGLDEFSAFEKGDYGGITFLDTFFVKRSQLSEGLFFHELIHVIQWEALGPERFLMRYADGLERFGYQASPLEAMAYEAQRLFVSSAEVFDAQKFVLERLGAD